MTVRSATAVSRADTNSDSDPPASSPRLWWHVVALAVVLAVGFAVVGPNESFSADEGAVIVQTRVLQDGSWTMPHPVPDVDADGRWFPLENSIRTADGYAPYAKHPVYPLALRPFEAVAGVAGMVALSTVCTLAAAVAGALIARRWAARLAPATLWVLGVGSPLLFNGYLVIAHTIAAALCGAAALLVLRAAHDTARAVVVPAAAASIALGLAVLVRSEAVLLCAGLALALVVGSGSGLRRRLAVAMPIAGAGAAAYLLDGRLNRWVLGEAGVDPFTIRSGDGFLDGRIRGFTISWLRPGFGDELTAGGLLLVVAVVLAAVVGVLLRRRAPDETMLRAVGVALAAAALVRFVVEPAAVVPGLLPAFPLLAAALPLLWPVPRGDQRVLTVAFAVFALAVLATQYPSAGSSQWGARYLVAGLPLLVPVVLERLDSAVGALTAPTRRVLHAATAVTLGTLALTAVLGLRDVHSGTTDAIDHVHSAVTDGSEDPVVIATRAAVPRLAYDHLRHARWMLVPPEEVETALERLASQGEADVFLVGPESELDDAGLGRYDVAAEASRGPGDGVTVRRLDLAGR